ncbi:MAG: amylo-alpha-1,6-glucosidase [Candidatus Aenigmatarchaeota archaeon]
MANSYILADKGVFFHRFINGEFLTKWCGLWNKNKKYLEYFAIRINDDWLSKENQVGFVKGINYVVHFYETNDFLIKERIKLKDSLIISLRILNKTLNTKNFRLFLEFAVNFRNFDEGIVEKDYRTEYYENSVKISDNERSLIFKSSKNGIFVGNEFYKIHYPSNQAFKCFLPKSFVIYDFIDNVYRVDFFFLIDKKYSDVFEKLNKADRSKSYNNLLLKNKLETNIEFINDLYKIAILNLKSCYDGNSFIAGYPWFAYYWSRDAAFSIIGASLTSMQNYAKNSLIFFFKYFEDKFPNFILENKVAYNTKDSLPLFIIALYEYFKNSGDIEIIKLLKNKLIKSLDWYRKNSSDHGFIYSESNETWMDTINREGYNLEIQVFWYYALKCLSKFFEILNLKELENLSKIYSQKLKENILKYFLKNNVFVDNLKTNKITINSIFPFVFGITRDKEIFENVENHLKEEYGFLSLSKYDNEFNESEYHKGASWYHLNALVSYVYFELGEFEKGLEMLKNLYELKDAYCKDCLIEVYNAKNKSIMIKKPIGIEETSYLQAWSAANIIYAIQKGILGLDVNISSISLKPYINFSINRKIGNDIVRITYFNNKISYSSLKNKKYRILLKYI